MKILKFLLLVAIAIVLCESEPLKTLAMSLPFWGGKNHGKNGR